MDYAAELAQDNRWITVKPNGPDHKGRPVEIDDSGRITKGMGGKSQGEKIIEVRKDFMGRMFDMMLPSSSLKLHLSKMNMFGIGNRMMRRIMKRKGIDSLETLRRQAIDNGVEFIACQMSMDVMGVRREELLDNVTVGGVASYMERAGKANVNLFI